MSWEWLCVPLAKRSNAAVLESATQAPHTVKPHVVISHIKLIIVSLGTHNKFDPSKLQSSE